MSVQTTRRLAQLQEQCLSLEIPYSDEDGRLELMDKLRERIGTVDLTLEIDPMKAKDLKSKIAWGTPDPFTKIAEFLTTDYVAEPKLDGCRMRMFLGQTGTTMNTGRRSVKTFAYIDRTGNFPHFAQIASPDLAGVILDGEVLAPTERIQTHTGTWTNSLLNASVALVNSKPEGAIATQERFGKARYFVFDILTGPGGDSIQHLPYDQRRAALELAVEALQLAYPDCGIEIVDQHPATVETILDAIRNGFEGVVLKHRTGAYLPGSRGPEWLKVKTMSTADAFVCDYRVGMGRHTGKVGSLELAVYDQWTPEHEGDEDAVIDGVPYVIVPVAQVGNLTDELRDLISEPDGSLRQTFYGTVIEFLGQGVGKNQRVRHPHMVRIRPDKTAQECLADQLDVFPRV